MKKLTYIFDIDGTIMSQTTPRDYPSAKPYEDMREHINSLYDAGHKIKFFTARGCSSGKDWTEFTKKQLDDFGFKYHELIMNRKPGGDIFIDDLAVNAVEYRKRLNPKRGLLAGAFDVIHPGYIRLFKDAKENACDHLIIALQTDPTLDRPEKIKPAQSWEDRKEILSAIKFVDEVIPYSTEASLLELLKEIKPDVRIIGSDYEGKEFTGSNLGIPNYFHKRNHNYSSTLYKKMIQQSLNKQNGE